MCWTRQEVFFILLVALLRILRYMRWDKQAHVFQDGGPLTLLWYRREALAVDYFARAEITPADNKNFQVR